MGFALSPTGGTYNMPPDTLDACLQSLTTFTALVNLTKFVVLAKLKFCIRPWL